MADKGAHLTSTLQATPTIFDYLAQENLKSLLHPAGKKVVDVLFLKFPKLAPVLHWYDEVFLGCSSILHLYYLKKYGGSFSEFFYSLRRVTSMNQSMSTLSKKELALAIFALTVVPYLRQKLNAKAEQLYFSTTIPKNKSRKQQIIELNRMIQVTFELAGFIQHLRYLSGNTQYNSPMLWLIGQKLIYNEEFDDSLTWRNSFAMLIQKGFELGAFFLQCYQRLQGESLRGFGTLPTPPPPKISSEEAEFAGICPICRQIRQVETALSVSGLVFCFACIQKYIAEFHQCPVTKLPASFQDLIRLYPDEF